MSPKFQKIDREFGWDLHGALRGFTALGFDLAVSVLGISCAGEWSIATSIWPPAKQRMPGSSGDTSSSMHPMMPG